VIGQVLTTLPLLLLLAGFAPSGPVAAHKGTVNVAYAASLQALNEGTIGPGFTRKTGYSYQGQGMASGEIANEIKGKIITPDVVEMADPAANRQLMGKSNGSYVKWFVDFARTRLVVGYDPKGKFARLFREVNHHRLAWYKPLLTKGLRFGRTDPQIDPKGYRVIWAFRLAQKLFHLKNFERRVLGPVENAGQVYPENVLVSRLQTGEIDAGIFYLSEAKAAGIPYINLPHKIDLGERKFAKIYATQHFTTDKGQSVTGAPILYTITIPRTVKDKAGAIAFVKFVLSKRAAKASARLGLLNTKHTIGGDRKAVPPGV